MSTVYFTADDNQNNFIFNTYIPNELRNGFYFPVPHMSKKENIQFGSSYEESVEI